MSELDQKIIDELIAYRPILEKKLEEHLGCDDPITPNYMAGYDKAIQIAKEFLNNKAKK